MSGETNIFSIIIPFKSGKQYLLDCLHSVLDQDYPHYNIIILADNTSNPDGALDAVNAIQNNKISIQIAQQNIGILENWGRIKELNKNEYMTILGYDDILEKTFLSSINELIHQHPEASLYHTHFNYINSNSEFIKICQPLPKHLDAIQCLELALSEKMDIMATGYVFKSSDYDAIGGIPTNYPNLIYADLQLWLALTKKSYLVVDPSIQFSFRLHASTTKTSKDAILLDAFIVFLDYLNDLKKESNAFWHVIQANAQKFCESTTKSIAHRLLRTKKGLRNGLTIDQMIKKIEAKCISLDIPYEPLKINAIRLARTIESSLILNSLLLLFKKIYKKPIL
jgi:glycosyltransferase involved in cell wall biosynthesis